MAEAKAADLLGQLEAQLAAVIEATGIDPNDVISMPVIEGTVLAFDEEAAPGLAAIDRGTKHGVKQGFTFEVYSDGLYRGRVRVITVGETQCVARAEKLYEGRTIEKGDSRDQALTRKISRQPPGTREAPHVARSNGTTPVPGASGTGVVQARAGRLAGYAIGSCKLPIRMWRSAANLRMPASRASATEPPVRQRLSQSLVIA